MSLSSEKIITPLLKKSKTGEMITADEALSILDVSSFSFSDVMDAAETLRKKYFSNYVQIHVINNIKNGHCQEDCGYCAQRNNAPESDIVKYYTKPEEEIMKEAEAAYKSGAFRYCLVTSGRGPGDKFIRQYADLVKKIKTKFPLEVCLSAGLVTDPAHAAILREAGLDRYNHNINSSESHYSEICSTHTFSDRLRTLENMSGNGISLCSGVIVGMGESDQDIVDMAFRLKKLKAASIPVNFFIPVPGHDIKKMSQLDADKCLRILALFRIINPESEIRIAAGREFYLKERQSEGLRIANSLFVSGYLNVRGDDAYETLRMIKKAGFEIDTQYSEMPEMLNDGEENITMSQAFGKIQIKDKKDLRPFETS